MRQHLLYIMLLLAAFFTSCSDDAVREGGEYAEGVMTRVSLSVSSRRAGTRATGTPEDAAYDIEKIHNWWVVFVDRGGVVRTIVTRPTDRTDYVEEERIEVDVPTGTYTLYAFANISQADLQTKTGVSFTAGSTYAANSAETAQIKLLQDWDNDVDIPMSGKQSVTVTGRANEVFSIEVVRMLAKMDIQYSNESVKDITINSLRMTQSPSDYIPLLPNYTYLGSGWPVDKFVDGTIVRNNATPATYGNPYTYSNSTFTHSMTVKDAHTGSDPWQAVMRWTPSPAVSVSASDLVDLSFTITSDKDLTVRVKVEQQGDGGIFLVSEDISLTAGVPYRYSKSSMTGVTMTNATLVLGCGNNNPANTEIQVKDLVFRKTVARPYLRNYSPKETLTAYSGSGTPSSWTDRFYMRESQANDNVAQRYLMTVNVTRQGSSHSEDMLFALTRELSSIYRNDHIVLPVIISDYTVKLDVNFYPPICGYPAVITRESDSEFLCEFATYGSFEIKPQVVNASKNYVMVYGTGDPHYEYEVKSVSDPDNIFTIPPFKEVGTGEILGELSTKEGVAYVDIEVTVKRTYAADEVYERRIYIIRKN